MSYSLTGAQWRPEVGIPDPLLVFVLILQRRTLYTYKY